MHKSVKTKERCEKHLDPLADHPVTCGIGGYTFMRHTGINSVIGEAGKAAGYSVLHEQVIPELSQFSSNSDGSIDCLEARLD